MRNIRLLMEYDGTNYHGWQSQPGGRTIQQALEAAIERLTGTHSPVLAAGRTDSGVHALGQVASFKTRSGLPIGDIHRALNALIPHDIRLLEVQEAPADFHPRYGAVEKEYFYLIRMGRTASVFTHGYSWLVPHALDITAMREAGGALLGQHDFRAFMGSGSDVRTTLRTLTLVLVEMMPSVPFLGAFLGGPYLKVTVSADGFLKHMVRNIVGTLVEVGKGSIDTRDMQRILASLDRTQAGPTAPAHGLFLGEVRY